MLSEFAAGIVGVLIGGFFGHRLALGRDKRLEYNAIADPLFERLENQVLLAEKGQFPNDANDLDVSSFITLRRKISKKEGRNLDRALQQYEKAKNECGYFGPGGLYDINRPEILISAIRDLQAFVQPR